MTTLPYISPVSGNGNQGYDQKMTITQNFYFIRIKICVIAKKNRGIDDWEITAYIATDMTYTGRR
jgi:hypothetical protein